MRCFKTLNEFLLFFFARISSLSNRHNILFSFWNSWREKNSILKWFCVFLLRLTITKTCNKLSTSPYQTKHARIKYLNIWTSEFKLRIEFHYYFNTISAKWKYFYFHKKNNKFSVLEYRKNKHTPELAVCGKHYIEKFSVGRKM